MKIIKTNCIVLKKVEMREADLLVTLFSKDYGKIMATAYGIRKSKKRDVISLNPLNKVEVTLIQKNNYYIVKDIEIIKNFKHIMKDIEKLEISLYILDSVNKIYDINYENEDFFNKLEEIFDFINNLESLKKGYKYYIVLTFLRRIMLEQGIYDTDEINRELGVEFSQLYREIAMIHKNNIGNIEKTQEDIERYCYSLRKIVEIFENYINRNLQVKIEIKKFIMEDL